jgi:hypothetical protein
MSREWLSILSQAGIVVFLVGGFWLFLELNPRDPSGQDDWFAEAAGLLTMFFACMAL